jgi:hypothetical protein
MSGTTTLTSGALVLPTAAGNLVTFTGALSVSAGTITGSATSNIVTNGGCGSSNVTFTPGAAQLNNWSIGSSSFGASTPTGLASVVTINGTFSLATTGAPDIYTTSNGGLIIPSGATYTDNATTNNRVMGNGSFTLQSGANFLTGNTTSGGALTATGTGAIQTTTRTFSGGANYTFSNATAQFMGDALDVTISSGKTGPITGNVTINNASGVTLNTGTTITINSPGIFKVGTGSSSSILTGGATSVINGTGSFVLSGNGSSSGSTLVTAHANGVNGTVQTTGTNDLSNGTNNNTNFTFNGAVAQTTGALLPATINNFTNSNTFVSSAASPALTFSGSSTVNGTLTVGAQYLAIGAGNTLTVNGALTIGTASRLVGSATSNLSIGGSGTIGGSGLFAATTSLNNLTMNRSGSTLAAGSALTVGGTFSLTAGVLSMSTNTLALNGPIAFGAGTLTATGPLAIGGTGTISGSLTGTSSPLALTGLTLNRSGATLALGSAVTLSNGAGALALNAGIISLGNFDLTLSSATGAGTITTTGAFDATTMIQADGSGRLGKTIATGTPSFTFPIGDGGGANSTVDYSPVTLTFATNSTLGTIYARVSNSTHASMNTGSTPAHTLNRYWTLSNSSLVTYTYTAVYKYADADVTGTESSLKMSQWSSVNSAWTEYTSTADASANTITIGILNETTGALSATNSYAGRANPPSIQYTWVGGNSGNSWSDPNNWSPNTAIPSALDNVTIDGTGTACEILAGTAATVNNITVNGTGVLNIAATGGLSISGSITYAGSPASLSLSAASTITYNGANAQSVIAFNYGNLAFSGTGAKTLPAGTAGVPATYVGIAGTYSVSGTAPTYTGSIIDYNGSGAQTISGGATGYNYDNLYISGARGGTNVTLQNGVSVFVSGTFNPSATGVGSWVTTGNTVNLNGTGAQTVPAFNFNNLTISGARTTNSVTLVNGGTIGIGGTFTTSATFSTGAYVITNNTVDFTGNSSQTISAFSFNNLSNSGNGARTLSGTINIAGTYTPTTGAVTVGTSVLNFNGNNQTIPASSYYSITNTSGTGTRTLASSGTISIAGSFTPGALTYTVDNSTVQYTNTTGGTLTAFTVATTPANPLGRQYHNLSFTGNGSWALSDGMTLAIAGNLSVGNTGSFKVSNASSGTNNLVVDGNFTHTAGSFYVCYAAGSANMTVNGNFSTVGNFNMSDFPGISNLTVNGTSTLTGSLNMLTWSTSGNAIATFNGDLNISGNGSLQFEPTSTSTGSSVITVNGNLTSTSAGDATGGDLVDFGVGTSLTGNKLVLNGNFSHTGAGDIWTTGTGAHSGIEFGKAGTQTFFYNGTFTIAKASINIKTGSTVKLLSDLPLAVTTTSPIASMTVSGTLDAGTYAVTGLSNSASSSFTATGTIISANPNGINNGVEHFHARRPQRQRGKDLYRRLLYLQRHGGTNDQPAGYDDDGPYDQ